VKACAASCRAARAGIEAEQRIAGPDLEGVRERGLRQPREAGRVGAQRIVRIAREQPRLEGSDAGDRETLGTGEALPRSGLAVAPSAPASSSTLGTQRSMRVRAISCAS
jgi:hypothetical protein